MLLPYLAWVCFAGVLNYQFLQLNPDADGVDPTQPVQRIEF
jgi:tryptophan-rich sensory protein